MELSWGGIGVLAPSDREAEALPAAKGRRIVGGPATVASRLQGYVTAGAHHLILTPAGSTAGPEFYRLLAETGSRLRA
jgi:alkanesulfonate monooxygenase SsuD/methylene tetrahydromethanopterin reductase-like flavin-dependent oxidoreductase (luciferase family)